MEDFKQKYEDFYYNFARPIINKHNANLNKITLKIIKNNLLLYGVMLSINAFIALIITYIIAEHGNSYSNMLYLVVFAVGLPFVFFIAKAANPAKKEEANFKRAIMDKFVSVFGKFEWKYNHVSTNNLRKYWELIVFPKSFTAYYDDFIYGQYKDKIQIQINEFKTEKFSFIHTIPLMIPTFFLTLIPYYVIIGILGGIIFGIIFGFGASGETRTYTGDSPEGILISIILLLPPLLSLITSLFVVIPTIKYGGFQGLIVECNLPKNYNGHTCIYEKGITNRNINKKLHKNLAPIELEDVEFNKKYHIYSDDQIEARYVLTTAFIERYKNLQTSYNADYVRVEFIENKMLIVIQTSRDMLKFNPFMPLYKKDFDRVFNELIMLFSLIDTLKLDVKTGL